MGHMDYSESLRGEDDELVLALISALPESAIDPRGWRDWKF